MKSEIRNSKSETNSNEVKGGKRTWDAPRVPSSGKIARLPRVVREEINRRLDDGELGGQILEWLNEVPAVREIVVNEFGGKEISEQNLSAWRNGGYRDWVVQERVMELAVRLGENVGELKDSCQPMGEMMAVWVTAQLMMMTQRVEDAESEDERWRLLRGMSTEVARVRRGDYQAERVRIERDRVGLQRDKLEFERTRRGKKTEKEMWDWAMEKKTREKICKGCEGYVSQSQFIAMARKVYFADVDAEPEPEIFVRERREKAEGMAKKEMSADDPEFAPRVEELIARLKWEEEQVRKKRDEGNEPIPLWAIKAAQGESRLVKGGDEQGSTRRLEDSKGEEGSPRRHEDRKEEDVEEPPRRHDAKGEMGAGENIQHPSPTPDGRSNIEHPTSDGSSGAEGEEGAIKADQDQSRLIKGDEETEAAAPGEAVEDGKWSWEIPPPPWAVIGDDDGRRA